MTNLSPQTLIAINGISILFLGVISAAFFLYIVKNTSNTQKQTAYYFALNYIISSLGFVTYLTRLFKFESFSILTNNVLYIFSFYALWHGIANRNGYILNILKNKWMYANIFFIIIVNFGVFYLWYDSVVIRTAILITNMCAVITSHFFISFKHFATITKPADKLLRFILIFTVLFNLSSLPLVFFGGIELYLITSKPFQLIQGVAWSMSLITILMLDSSEKHYKESITDQLSGLYNRRFFEREVKKILTNRAGNKYAMVICDIDDFKSVNDNYGHHIGDLVIKGTSDCIKSVFNKNSIYGRYGGEEFVMFFPTKNREHIFWLADAFRKQVEAKTLIHQGLTINVTISVGITMIDDSSIESMYADTDINISDINDLQIVHYHLKKSDNALYQAKNTGKNKVCMA